MINAINIGCHVAPLCRFNSEDYFRIQGLEKQIDGPPQLYFTTGIAIRENSICGNFYLDTAASLGTGTFRNSLYLESFSQLSSIRDIKLLIDYQGGLHFKLMCAAHGKQTQTLSEVKIVSPQRTQYLFKVGAPSDLPENSRLFWHIEALTGGLTVFDVNYVTNSKPRADCRLAVLLRTFGRTTDVKAILKRFADAGQANPYYAGVLDNIDFWVLDTTPECESAYQEAWQSRLNLRVLVGPNLGGGGNAGHMLKLFEDACQASSTPPTELLILDDDLTITPESLARYFAFCSYRTQEVICSLPVLMKSRPTVVWEDGGFWGRFNFHEGGSFNRKRNLFPNLLKHGRQLNGFEHLDGFAPLNTCEYSTFIFFGLSVKTFRKLGYPVPIFLRGDDIEFSLRAQEMGIQMITNPNLAAWHEPAHGYAQEYMAILHGIIVNLTYSEQDVDFYTRFFEERLYEHASIEDLAGIKLYADILSELIDAQSAILTGDFQLHYLQRLKQYGAVKFIKIPEIDRPVFEQKARDNGALLVPFVYPGYQKDTKKYRSIVVINHSAKAYREVPAPAPAEKAALIGDYLKLLTGLAENFEEIRDHWQQRLKACSGESFWNGIRDRYTSETKEIYRQAKKASAFIPVVDLPDAVAQESTLIRGEILHQKLRRAIRRTWLRSKNVIVNKAWWKRLGISIYRRWLKKRLRQYLAAWKNFNAAINDEDERANSQTAMLDWAQYSDDWGRPVNFDPEIYQHQEQPIRKKCFKWNRLFIKR